MTWFRSNQDEKLKQLLKNSGSDFQFDPNRVKYRLMTSVASVGQKPAHHFHFGRVAKYSVSFATVVMCLSVTAAFAFNSKPGDTLFALNKFGEQTILNLPLSVEQNAKVETYIVTNRLQALDQVQVQPTKNDLKTIEKKLATLKESDDSFAAAVDAISKNQKSLQASGKTTAAAKLSDVLNKLQLQAQKHEADIKALADQTTDKTLKAKIQAHLTQFQASGQRAREQIKSFQSNQGKESSDGN